MKSQLQDEILRCQKCSRLVNHRQEIALIKRRRYVDWKYWGKPVPSLGILNARLLIIGLAPGAHGANRTGRVFTGDSSGDLLYSTLHRFGFCNQPCSTHRGDGLILRDAYITTALHCVPPQNRPQAYELNNCRPYLREELRMLQKTRVVIALGRIAWQAYWTARKELGWPLLRPRPQFGHAVSLDLPEGTHLLGCYHPSRQNTQTGRLSKSMFQTVFSKAQSLLKGSV